MSAADLSGWLAASLMLATFASIDAVRLRALALAANVAFISYGLTVGLPPVVVLHLLLVPINLCRLWRAWQSRPRPDSGIAPSSARARDGRPPGGQKISGRAARSAWRRRRNAAPMALPAADQTEYRHHSRRNDRMALSAAAGAPR